MKERTCIQYDWLTTKGQCNVWNVGWSDGSIIWFRDIDDAGGCCSLGFSSHLPTFFFRSLYAGACQTKGQREWTDRRTQRPCWLLGLFTHLHVWIRTFLIYYVCMTYEYNVNWHLNAYKVVSSSTFSQLSGSTSINWCLKLLCMTQDDARSCKL